MKTHRRWGAAATLVVVSGMTFPMASTALDGQAVVTNGAPAKETARVARELLARPVTVNLVHVSLRHAIDAIAASAAVLVQYQAEVIDAHDTPVTLNVTSIPLRVALDRVLKGTTLNVVAAEGMKGVTIVEFGGSGGGEQGAYTGGVTGTVRDVKTRQPLRGANVAIDGMSKGVTTDEEGHYHILGVSPGSHTVTVRYLGYARQAQHVTVEDGATVALDLALEQSANTLDQVVVTGTIIPTELKAVPSAITVITEKQIEERGITHIEQLFRGDVPGLFAQSSASNNALDAVTMFSRGATALPFGQSAGTANGTNPIKTYIDGVELANPSYLSQIDPKSIERIEILTGPQASTIYGSNAINGVMQVFTKRGNSSTPQLTLNLMSGWVENNFSSAKTPQHDYSAQLNGVEGRISYNAGSSWNYVGPWTPAKQVARLSGFGGARLEIPAAFGGFTADVTLRRSQTQNLLRGYAQQTQTEYQNTGWYRNVSFRGLDRPTTSTLAGQTFGLTLGYVPMSWWSHEFATGQDVSDTEDRQTARGYQSRSDTTLTLMQNRTDRRSLRYTTTARVPITTLAQATITVGADAWKTVTSFLYVQPQVLTGALTNTSTYTDIERQPDHNTGGFVQGQLGIQDKLFFTYGIRAEWNPNFGADAQPNYAPRYGVAYTQDVGAVTAKLRASYGRSTRPPPASGKVSHTITEYYGVGSLLDALVSDYGNIDAYLANQELTPEYQQGGEGGVELYLGTRGSLVLTRYNQTVDGLITNVRSDSARSFAPFPDYSAAPLDPDGYGYWYQYQNLNIGSIRNQGWELQGSVRTGPVTTRGTYSWTKSRVIGITPKYREQFPANFYPYYQPGATFQFVPEHTWAVATTYTSAQTTVSLNVIGIGQLTNLQNAFSLRSLSTDVRLLQNRLRLTDQGYVNVNNGYVMADLTMSRSLSARMGGVLQVQNLTNYYTSDFYAADATLGRQVKGGFRIRL